MSGKIMFTFCPSLLYFKVSIVSDQMAQRFCGLIDLTKSTFENIQSGEQNDDGGRENEQNEKELEHLLMALKQRLNLVLIIHNFPIISSKISCLLITFVYI